MQSPRIVTTLVLAMWAWAASASPAAAQGVGAISGTVVDGSGGALPGATVALSSAEGTVGGSREAVTDDRGTYQFLRLVPGTYAVKAELQGFRRATQDKIVVNADVTVRADLKLEVGSMEESITVSGQAPLLDTTSALNQTVLSRTELDALPNRINIWSIARVIPSVTLNKVDVGGSESYLNSTATVHGSSSENKIHDRRDGRLEHRWQRHDRRVLPGPVHLPGGQLSDRRRFGGDAERRPDLQHDQPHRHQPVSRRRHVQRRQPWHGVRQLLRRAEGAAARRRPRQGARCQSRHRARLRHPQHLGHRVLDRWTDQTRQALVLLLRPRPGTEPVRPGQLQRGRDPGTGRQQNVDPGLEGRVAGDQERPALLLQQPAVQVDRPSRRRWHVCGQRREKLQLQVSGRAPGEVHLALPQPVPGGHLGQPVPCRRLVRSGAAGGERRHFPLRRRHQHLHRGTADLPRQRDVQRRLQRQHQLLLRTPQREARLPGT